MTNLGKAALIGGAVLLGAGWVLWWPAFIVLGVGALTALAIGLVATLRRAQMDLQRTVEPTRVPRGSMALALVESRNVGRRRSPSLSAVMALGGEEFAFGLPKLERGQMKIRTYPLPTSRRGIWELSAITLRRRDHFGMVARDEVHGSSIEFVIEPANLGLRPISSGRDLSLDGPTSDNAPQGTVTFHRLREYVRGDDLRLIHWRSTAKTGGRQLLVRHNVDTVEPTTVVLLNLRPETYSEEEFEDAVDLAASVVRAEVYARAKVRLRTTAGDHIRVNDGGLNGIDFLTKVEPQSTGGLSDELLAVGREAQATSLVVVTGSITEDELSTVAKLRRRYARVVVLSVGEHSASNPFSGLVVLAESTASAIAASWNGGRHGS